MPSRPSGTLLFLLVPALLSCDIFSPGSGDEATLQVLFIGNSYLTWNNLPSTFREMAAAAGAEIELTEELLEGTPLHFFADDVQTRMKIRERDWDFVVLAGGALLAAYPDLDPALTHGRHPVQPALGTLKETIEANHPLSRTVYMMPWAYEDGVTWPDGSRDSYAEMQLRIMDNTTHWADSLDIMLAPAGMAWYPLLADDPPSGDLHHTDGNHPNPRGSYLTAATILATLLGESVVDMAYDGTLGAAEALMLRELASATVLENRAAWNIPN